MRGSVRGALSNQRSYRDCLGGFASARGFVTKSGKIKTRGSSSVFVLPGMCILQNRAVIQESLYCDGRHMPVKVRDLIKAESTNEVRL